MVKCSSCSKKRPSNIQGFVGCADEPAWVSKSPVLERDCGGYVAAPVPCYNEFSLTPPEVKSPKSKKQKTPPSPLSMRVPSPFSMKA